MAAIHISNFSAAGLSNWFKNSTDASHKRQDKTKMISSSRQAVYSPPEALIDHVHVLCVSTNRP